MSIFKAVSSKNLSRKANKLAVVKLKKPTVTKKLHKN